MDDFWARHKSFVLKILAGLGVCLLAWIVGSSLTEKDMDAYESSIGRLRRQIQETKAPPVAAASAYEQAGDRLSERILFLANRMGDLRTGVDLRNGLVRELLDLAGKRTPQNEADFLRRAEVRPESCLQGLVAFFADSIRSEAARRNVVVDDGLGFDNLQHEAGHLVRYLMSLKTIVTTIRLAMEEGATEIVQIAIAPPPGGRFLAEETFVSQFPVRLELRGPSAVLLRILDRLTDPADFRVLTMVGPMQRHRQDREEDLMTMPIEITALRIQPDASLEEVAR